jgi:hypothetical protein
MCFALAVSLLGEVAAAQTILPLTVDLANDPLKSTVPVSTGVALSIRITNMAPSIRKDGLYEVVVARETIPIPAFDLPEAKKAPMALAADDPCDVARSAIADLYAAPNETAAEKKARELRKKVADCAALEGEARDALATMTFDVAAPAITLRPGELIRVTVRRPEDKDVRTWEKVFTTGDAGTWLQSYGFAFIPNRDDQFFSKVEDDGKTFTITEKTDHHGMDFAPSIFFTWLPAPRESQTLNFGVTGGLGFDFKAPTVFLGGSAMWAQNVQLVAGVVMHQQRRLRGEFVAGQTVKESLDLDQLTDKTYRPNFFVGLALRLGKSPF